MKYKYYSRFIALVVIVSMLLSCMIMPVAVTAASESFDLEIKTMASDDSLTDNEILCSDEKAVLRSDDPIIKDSSILHYVDSAQFDNARHTVRLSELEDWSLLDEHDIADTQADAIASAFTDYIWEKIQNE